MRSSQRFVIVGAGLAGAKAAETLRQEGFNGQVVLIGDEPVRPYERPPLSKQYLRSEVGFEDAAVHPAGYYDEHDIELRAGSLVTGFDPASRQVTLSTGERLGYDRLLLATGATPRRLTVPGVDLSGVYYLRTVADAAALRDGLKAGGQVVVVGGGWVGSEVAASARQMGADVALVGTGSVLLERPLGHQVGAVYTALHTEHGVDVHTRVGVEAVLGSGTVEAVRLTDGTVLPARMVVVGVGVTPLTDLAEAGGLALAGGIAVDEHLRTSAEGVYAAGDVADAFHPRYGRRIRLEHWSAALNQGPVAARNMLGRMVTYEQTPYFFSDQYDVGMEFRGYAVGSDQVVIRGDLVDRQFIAFWLRNRRVTAAMNVNIWDSGDTIEALLQAGRPVDPARLSSIELTSLT